MILLSGFRSKNEFNLIREISKNTLKIKREIKACAEELAYEID